MSKSLQVVLGVRIKIAGYKNLEEFEEPDWRIVYYKTVRIIISARIKAPYRSMKMLKVWLSKPCKELSAL